MSTSNNVVVQEDEPSFIVVCKADRHALKTPPACLLFEEGGEMRMRILIVMVPIIVIVDYTGVEKTHSPRIPPSKRVIGAYAEHF